MSKLGGKLRFGGLDKLFGRRKAGLRPPWWRSFRIKDLGTIPVKSLRKLELEVKYLRMWELGGMMGAAASAEGSARLVGQTSMTFAVMGSVANCPENR
jgi:hypothetical protein